MQAALRIVWSCILLGLEVLIIADIVLTITVDRTFDSAITLGIIVLVRTFLSFSLEIELEGTLPWRRGSTDKRPDPSVSVRRRTRLSEALGYRSWGGVPDACRQVRATRRSP